MHDLMPPPEAAASLGCIIPHGGTMERINERGLSVKAQDNHGYEYTVSVFQWAEGRWLDRWVLRIHDTPGSWYLDMLLKEVHGDVLAIDYGQNWLCTNIQSVLAEARTLVPEVIHG